ncbi:hypothetical protein Ddye_021587 [Dipteronia dyeriana]|uniref:Uncharacterized protein n=1 Tax=Dipteronia dyeriana TaxID=168575 RepID=A0AAD9U2H6_9ROSI|nr:hypothetical protein Ddye_021587 [Dipteronia dyeriana]
MHMKAKQLWWGGRNNCCICYISTESCEDTPGSTSKINILWVSNKWRRQAIYYRGISHLFNTICKEGFLGLYKGLGASLLGVGHSIAITFSVSESLRSFWQYQSNISTSSCLVNDAVRKGLVVELVSIVPSLCICSYQHCKSDIKCI